MRNKIDNILLGLLWLLAMTLVACFWFNTKFGFNLFSVAHWQYLSYMQVAQTPVRPAFYVSLVIFAFIMLFGLYLIVRPRRRKIHLATKQAPRMVTPVAHIAPLPAPVAAQNRPAPANIDPHATTPQPSSQMTRPRALVTSTFRPLQTPQNIVQAPKNNSEHNRTEIVKIFESNGYIVKKATSIVGVRPDVLAIGTNETLWIGATNIDTVDLRHAMDKLARVFADTLDDIYININGFVIAARDAATNTSDDILMFASVDELREYMSAHRNPPPAADDVENFDAYSEYIDTVINYIGKI